MVQAKEEFVSALIGEGIKPSFVVDDPKVKEELQDVWSEWTNYSDADGLTDFEGQQGVIGSEMYEAGECFVRFRPRKKKDGYRVPLQIQILPSEMCPTWYNVPLAGGARIECGVQFSPIGVREGYWFYKRHPGEQVIFNTADAAQFLYFIPADQILHLFKPIRAGQIRGIPHTLAGIITVALLDLYDDAELERKRTAALFTAFITREAGEEDAENPLGGTPTRTDAVTGQTSAGMEPGATVELTPGQNVSFAQPGDVGNNYEAFEYRNLLRVAAGTGVPYMNLTGDLRQANYGSQRGGLITFKRRISAMQHSVIVFQLCRPVAEAWLQAALLSGAFDTFTAAEYLAAPRSYGDKIRWITPKWDWIDPLKDLTAEKLAVDAGFKCRSDVIESMGYDGEEVDEAIAKDQARAAKLGLKFVTLKTSVSVSPTEDDADISTLDNPTNPAGGPGNPAGSPEGGNTPPNQTLTKPAKKGGNNSGQASRKRKAKKYPWDD